MGKKKNENKKQTKQDEVKTEIKKNEVKHKKNKTKIETKTSTLNKKVVEKKEKLDVEPKIKQVEESVSNEEKSSPFLTVFLIIILSILGVLFYLKYHKNQLAHNKIINHSLVTTGSGLYVDTFETGIDSEKPFTSKYYFSGKEVNNYLLFYNKCFRIINIAQNDAIKIMYIGPANNSTCDKINYDNQVVKWDENNKNVWTESTLKNYLDNWANNNYLNDSPYLIKDAIWYVGGLYFNAKQNLTEDIKNERKPQFDENVIYKGLVGLINTSDYMKATERLCIVGAANDQGECSGNNYLNNGNNYWTINKTLNSSEHVWAVENGIMQSKLTTNEKFQINPVVYLKANLVFKGNGTTIKPYTIAK